MISTRMRADPRRIRTALPEARQVEQLRGAVQRLLVEQRLDVLVYPSWNNPPRALGDLNSPHGSNGPRIASVVGFPAITIPMGFVRGILPVGLELLGSDWSEPKLLDLAYDYEQATRHRRPPPTTPALACQRRVEPRARN